MFGTDMYTCSHPRWQSARGNPLTLIYNLLGDVNKQTRQPLKLLKLHPVALVGAPDEAQGALGS